MSSRALVLPIIAVTACCLAGCATHQTYQRSAAAAVPIKVAHTEPVTTTPAPPLRLPGLGPRTLAQVPANATQVVVVTGAGMTSPTSTVVLWQRNSAGWQAGATWPAHNALDGWTNDPSEGDLRTPIGVYGLTDAGGLLPDPGSHLPYTRSSGFEIGGTGFDGEPLAGSFDYVIAINYNRKPGTDPLNWTRPLGLAKGGGVWFHVDHGGPTHGCVSLPRADLIALLQTLSPADHPVVVMGDATSLAN